MLDDELALEDALSVLDAEDDDDDDDDVDLRDDAVPSLSDSSGSVFCTLRPAGVRLAGGLGAFLAAGAGAFLAGGEGAFPFAPGAFLLGGALGAFLAVAFAGALVSP